jgi:hypothetical protein
MMITQCYLCKSLNWSKKLCYIIKTKFLYLIHLAKSLALHCLCISFSKRSRFRFQNSSLLKKSQVSFILAVLKMKTYLADIIVELKLTLQQVFLLKLDILQLQSLLQLNHRSKSIKCNLMGLLMIRRIQFRLRIARVKQMLHHLMKALLLVLRNIRRNKKRKRGRN